MKLLINRSNNEIILLINNDIIAAPRPRVTKWGTTYYPKKYSDFKKELKDSINKAITEPLLLVNKPLEIFIKCEFKIPKSYTKKKIKELENMGYYHIKKPDVDNIAKTYMDSLVSSGVINDDSIIVKLSIIKKYNPELSNDITTITISHIDS